MLDIALFIIFSLYSVFRNTRRRTKFITTPNVDKRILTKRLIEKHDFFEQSFLCWYQKTYCGERRYFRNKEQNLTSNLKSVLPKLKIGFCVFMASST